MQRWLGAALLAAVAGAAQARPVVLTPAQLRDDGFRAMAAGDARDAHDAALALIGRDPKDFLAQILRSRSARALGLNAEARAAARTAWELRRTPQDGYVAATVRAQALASSDMRVMAQLWLRKAADLAPSPVLRAQAIRDLAYVRSRSHWAFKLSASLMPSSNVNNGSASSTVSIFGLPFQLSGSAQALSGLVATTDATAIWRLTPTERTVSQATLRGVATHNWLSASAKAQAPGVQGDDFDYDALEAGFSQKFRFSVQDLTIFNWSVLAGHAWYGGRDLSTYGRLSFGAERALAPKLTGALGFSLERQLREDSFSNSAVIWSGWGSLTRPLANGDQLQATVGLSDTQSASVTVDNRSGYIELDWSKAKPVAGMLLGLSVFAQTGKYGPSIYAAGGRRDLTLAGQATIAFPKAAYMGFAPELTLQLRNVNSNVGLYQAQTFGLGLGIRSVF